MAPLVAATGVAGVAAAEDETVSTANGREVTPEGMPVRVPAPIAAAVVDSLFDAAIAAMLDATGLVVDEEEDVGVLLLMEEPGFAPLEAEASELLLPPALPLALTSWPPDVGKTAEAPDGAGVVAASDADPVVAAAAAGADSHQQGND